MSGMISDTYSSAHPIAMGDRGATYPILSHLTILRMRARGPRTLAKGHHIQSSVILRYTDEGLCALLHPVLEVFRTRAR